MGNLSSHPIEPPSHQSAGEGASPDGLNGAWRPLPPLGSDPAIRASTPPAILEAQQTYLHDLPELLKERRGQWVAYHGAKRLAFAKTKSELWQECLRQGYEEFLVRYIEPHPEVDFISAL